MILQIMNNNQNMAVDEDQQSVKHSDFSIDHILNRAGSNIVKNNDETVYCERIVSENLEKFDWLQCSRYCPPKVPRIHKKDVQKRQLGRHPRIPFTSRQLSVLEQKFRQSPYLSSEEVIVLSKKLQLADIRVKIWFQNRRARERREKNGAFGENKVSEDGKNIPEEIIPSCSTNRRLPGVSNFSFGGTDDGDRNTNDTFTLSNKSTVKSEPLDCTQTSMLTVTNVSDIFKSSGVPSTYILANSVSSQNVPFFIPFVNFNHDCKGMES